MLTSIVFGWIGRSKFITDSEEIQYDRERMIEDSEYRKQVLSELKAESGIKPNTFFGIKLLFWTAGALVIFLIGIIFGSRLTQSQAFWFTLNLMCFVVLPILGFALLYARKLY